MSGWLFNNPFRSGDYSRINLANSEIFGDRE